MNDSELMTQLRNSGRADLDPTVASRIRQATITEFTRVMAEPEQHPTRWFAPSVFFAQRAVGATAIILLVVVLGFGTSIVANAAKPGDLLFGVDRVAEQVRLRLTTDETAKATYEAEVAEERAREQAKLEGEQSDHASEASELTRQALEQALGAVARVQEQLTEKQGNGSEALMKVETRLRELQGERERRLRITVEPEGERMKIKVVFGRSEWEWVSTAVTISTVQEDIAVRTGLPIDQIRAALPTLSGENRVEDEPEVSNDESISNTQSAQPTNTRSQDTKKTTTKRKATKNVNVSVRNTNGAANTNTSVRESNRNVNSERSDRDERLSTSKRSITVHVHLGDGVTEIQTVMNGREQEWRVRSIIQADVLASIRAKTGLSVAEITAIWDYEQR